MGESTIRLSRYQIDAISTRFNIEGIPKYLLLKINLCKLCGLATSCTQYTNGTPIITLPANQVNRHTIDDLNSKRSCKDL